MELNVYTVYDSKAQAYMTPFHVRSRGEAIRSFTEACNNPESVFNKYPGDFTLFEIGTWDDQEGIIKMSDVKQNIGLATHFKRVEHLPEVPVKREKIQQVELTQ